MLCVIWKMRNIIWGTFFGSQPDNNAVVYGAEKYILVALERLKAEEKQPSCLLIESSCSFELNR